MMENSNPLVAVTLHFKDGVALRQVFTTPVPQPKAMAALGKMVAELGGELSIQLEPSQEGLGRGLLSAISNVKSILRGIRR